MKLTPEEQQIEDASAGIVRVDETESDQARDRASMVADATQALSGETLINQGEDKGWRFIGGVNFNQPLYVRGGNGAPLVKVTIEPTPNLPAEYLQRVLPVLIKRDMEGGLLRLTIRFDDDSMAYSNQPTKKQMGWLMGLLAKTGAMKPK
jgi:hypothetical protein